MPSNAPEGVSSLRTNCADQRCDTRPTTGRLMYNPPSCIILDNQDDGVG